MRSREKRTKINVKGGKEITTLLFFHSSLMEK